jgi:hypothetical protein
VASGVSVLSYKYNARLKYRGSWRVQAVFTTDGYSPAATTGWRSFTVK